MDSAIEPLDDGELLQRKSLSDMVFDTLHRRIVAGKYQPGEWLRQEEISTHLNVSQTPVREALDRLVAVGLAERVIYRGVRVLEQTHAEIVNAYVARLVLEEVLARLAAQNATPEQIAELLDIVEQTRRLVTLEDMSAQRQLNKKFHLLIAEASSNSLLSKIYQVASNHFPDWRLYEYMFRHPDLLESSLEREYSEHNEIANAIAVHDAGLAARHTLEHIHNLAGELVEFLGVPASSLAQKEGQVCSLPFNPLNPEQ